MSSRDVCDQFISAILNKQLTGIVIIHGYVQLLFDKAEPYDDLVWNIYSKCRVTGEELILSPDAQEETRLHSLIGARVTSLDGSSDDEFVIEWNTGDKLSFSLKQEDYNGPEAANLANNDNLMIVFN